MTNLSWVSIDQFYVRLNHTSIHYLLFCWLLYDHEASHNLIMIITKDSNPSKHHSTSLGALTKVLSSLHPALNNLTQDDLAIGIGPSSIHNELFQVLGFTKALLYQQVDSKLSQKNAAKLIAMLDIDEENFKGTIDPGRYLRHAASLRNNLSEDGLMLLSASDNFVSSLQAFSNTAGVLSEEGVTCSLYLDDQMPDEMKVLGSRVIVIQNSKTL